MSEEERLADEAFSEAEARLEDEHQRILEQIKKRLEDIKRKYIDKLSKV